MVLSVSILLLRIKSPIEPEAQHFSQAGEFSVSVPTDGVIGIGSDVAFHMGAVFLFLLFKTGFSV